MKPFQANGWAAVQRMVINFSAAYASGPFGFLYINNWGNDGRMTYDPQRVQPFLPCGK